MSSEELTKTVDVLKNVKKKMQMFNTSKKEAEELFTVRSDLEQVLTMYNKTIRISQYIIHVLLAGNKEFLIIRNL